MANPTITVNHKWIREQMDITRGELDKKNHQEPGWSGPITSAYLIGYGKHPRHAEHREQNRQEELLMRGWNN